MLVVSCKPSSPMGPSIVIRHMIMDQRLVDIRSTTYLPEFSSSRMGAVICPTEKC